MDKNFIELFKQSLKLNEETGEFYCRKTNKRRGHRNPDGYWVIKLRNKNYSAHRLVWVYLHGPIPEGMEIDHIDRDRLNNRPINLRLVSKTENSRNRGVTRRNTTGLKGVFKRGGRFRAGIRCDGKMYWLGHYITADEAHRARQSAQELLSCGKLPPSSDQPTIRNTTGVRGISQLKTGAFAVKIHGEHVGTYRSMEDAVQAKEQHLSSLPMKATDKDKAIKLRDKLTLESISATVSYDSLTGQFTNRHTKRIVGSRVLSGYITLWIGDHQLHAQKAAYWIMTGHPVPQGKVIDHINGDRSDNRWINLRAASRSQNAGNRQAKPNLAGYLGVSRLPNGKFRARLCNRSLGVFDTAEEASRVYDREAQNYYGDFVYSSREPLAQLGELTLSQIASIEQHIGKRITHAEITGCVGWGSDKTTITTWTVVTENDSVCTVSTIGTNVIDISNSSSRMEYYRRAGNFAGLVMLDRGFQTGGAAL